MNSLGHHRPSPRNDEYDGRQSPQRLSSIHISQQKERWIQVNSKNMTKKHVTLQKLQHRKSIRVKKGVSRNTKTRDKMFNEIKFEI